MAAWVPDMFWNFYKVTNDKIANNSTTNKARKKISTYLAFLEFYKTFDVSLNKYKNNQILLCKISQLY